MNKRKIIKEIIERIKQLSTKQKIEGVVLYTITSQALNSLLAKEDKEYEGYEGQDRKFIQIYKIEKLIL